MPGSASSFGGSGCAQCLQGLRRDARGRHAFQRDRHRQLRRGGAANLVHIDINPDVFSANYPAQVKIAGDAKTVLSALLAELRARGGRPVDRELHEQIARDKKAYREEWYAHDSKGRVNPARFFDELRRQMPPDAVTVLDDGNHTFLAAELFPSTGPRA